MRKLIRIPYVIAVISVAMAMALPSDHRGDQLKGDAFKDSVEFWGNVTCFVDMYEQGDMSVLMVN